MVRYLAVFGLFLLGFAGSPVAGEGDEVKGLIVDRCSDCHVLAGYEERAADVGAPTLRAIADDPEKFSETKMRAYLQKPHWPMEQFNLSPTDIDHIVAFFEQMRAP